MSLFGTSGPSEDEFKQAAVIKPALTVHLKEAVRKLQTTHISSEDAIYSEDSANMLCSIIEAIFLHGLKASIAKKFSIIVGSVNGDKELNFWEFIKFYTHKDTVNQLNRLGQITTRIGMCRAWIRLALNDSLLESYLQSMFRDKRNLQVYYRRLAYLRDPEQSEIMKSYIQGLSYFKFELSYNASVLNIWSVTPLVLAGLGDPQAHTPEAVIKPAQAEEAYPGSYSEEIIKSSIDMSGTSTNYPEIQMANSSFDPSGASGYQYAPHYDPSGFSHKEVEKMYEIINARQGNHKTKEYERGSPMNSDGSFETAASQISMPDPTDDRAFPHECMSPKYRSHVPVCSRPILSKNSIDELNSENIASILDGTKKKSVTSKKGKKKKSGKKKKAEILANDDIIESKTSSHKVVSLKGSFECDGVSPKEAQDDFDVISIESSGQEKTSKVIDKSCLDSNNFEFNDMNNDHYVQTETKNINTDQKNTYEEALSKNCKLQNDITCNMEHLTMVTADELQEENVTKISETESTSISYNNNSQQNQATDVGDEEKCDDDNKETQVSKFPPANSCMLGVKEEKEEDIEQSNQIGIPENQANSQLLKTEHEDIYSQKDENAVSSIYQTSRQQSNSLSHSLLQGGWSSPFDDDDDQLENVYDSNFVQGFLPTAVNNSMKVEGNQDIWSVNTQTAKTSSEEKTVASHSMSSPSSPAQEMHKSIYEEYEILDENGEFATHLDAAKIAEFKELISQLTQEKGLDIQNYQCFGCKRSIGMFFCQPRICVLDGANYCYECHENDEFYIPARILLNWDFRKHLVCKENLNLLRQFEDSPILNVFEINSKMYDHVKDMASIRDLRQQLKYLKAYMFTCKESTAEEFRQQVWPKEYLYDDIHKYSLLDLLQVPSGQLSVFLRKVIKTASQHVYSCRLCREKGFICEICNNPKVIYPFQLEYTSKCQQCQAVYHKQCKTNLVPCPKCRRQLQRHKKLGTGNQYNTDYAYSSPHEF